MICPTIFAISLKGLFWVNGSLCHVHRHLLGSYNDCSGKKQPNASSTLRMTFKCWYCINPLHFFCLSLNNEGTDLTWPWNWLSVGCSLSFLASENRGFKHVPAVWSIFHYGGDQKALSWKQASSSSEINSKFRWIKSITAKNLCSSLFTYKWAGNWMLLNKETFLSSLKNKCRHTINKMQKKGPSKPLLCGLLEFCYWYNQHNG